MKDQLLRQLATAATEAVHKGSALFSLLADLLAGPRAAHVIEPGIRPQLIVIVNPSAAVAPKPLKGGVHVAKLLLW